MLSETEIIAHIAADSASEAKQLARIGERYYRGEHDILTCRLFYYNADGEICEDRARANRKISHPFFAELADQLTSYLLSQKEPPIRAAAPDSLLEGELGAYFGEAFQEQLAIAVTDCYVKGVGYMYAYKNAEDRLTFEAAEPLSVTYVGADASSDGREYVIYKTKRAKKKGAVVRVYDSESVAFYAENERGELAADPGERHAKRPHTLYVGESGEETGEGIGELPFYAIEYNKERRSGIAAIKSLIDDYDLHACALSNNLIDFDTPIHVVSGYQGDDLDELQQNLRTKKIIGVDSEGDVRVRTVDIPHEARRAKLEIDERNIYRFGMGLNTSGLKDTSATTNIAIKAAYSLLELKANKVEKPLRRMLWHLAELALEEINERNGREYTRSDIKLELERHIMTNEAELAENKKTAAAARQLEVNTALIAAEMIGEERAKALIARILGVSD